MGKINKQKEAKEEESKTEKTEEIKVEEKPSSYSLMLSLNLHCLGCSKKIQRLILKTKGVEGVDIDYAQNQLNIKGVVEPQPICDMLEKKIKRKVTILSSSSLLETKVQPVQVSESTTMELNVNMHCEACAAKLKKMIQKMKGVTRVETELNCSKVRVTGTMEANKLVDYVYRRTKKKAKLVLQPEPVPEPENLKEEEKPQKEAPEPKPQKPKEEENPEEKAPEPESKKEEAYEPEEEENEEASELEEEKTASSSDETPPKSKGDKKGGEPVAKKDEGDKKGGEPVASKEEEGGKKGGEPATKKEENAAAKEEGKMVEMINSEEEQESIQRVMYYSNNEPLYFIERIPPPQIFSDENPNACCIT